MTIYKIHPNVKKEITARFADFQIEEGMIQVYELVMNGEILLGNSVEEACAKAFKAAMEIPEMYIRVAKEVYSN